jgi:two-component system cell cycle response regulator DivK
MAQNTTNPTIMVVEDYDDTRFMLRQALESKGYRVIEAVDGWEAVQVATRERPDLILMDLNLPVLDGITATDILRGNEELHGVPVVAITAHNTTDSRADAGEAGCAEYLTKPIDIDELQSLVARLLH